MNGQQYLGCEQIRYQIDLPGGGKATADSKGMEDFMRSCVDLYLELAPGATLRRVATPFLREDQRDAPARAPATNGPCEICTWCNHSFPPSPYASLQEYERQRKLDQGPSGTSSGRAVEQSTGRRSGGDVSVDPEANDLGRLAPVAARILMKILYGARCARPDLLRAVSHLACFFTRWTHQCDRRLH